MMVDLKVNLFGIELKNPVMPAAGPPIKDAEGAHLAAAFGAGALVTKTISLKGAQVPRPNMASIRGGFMNTELWSEMGPEEWLEKEFPKIQEIGLPVIIGLGYQAHEIRELASMVKPYGQALELSTHYLGDDPTPVVESIEAAKEGADLPVLVKLSPKVHIPSFAKAAEEAGADGLVLINSFGPVLDFQIDSGYPYMGSKGGFGWLSGPAIFPLALRCVYEAVTTVKIPVIGVGGITTGIDALKMIMLGATAVQVCTAAILKGPKIYDEILSGMIDYMEGHAYSSLKELQGKALHQLPLKDQFETIIPRVLHGSCTACKRCIEICVYKAMKIGDLGTVLIDEGKCKGCGLCVSCCPSSALSLVELNCI